MQERACEAEVPTGVFFSALAPTYLHSVLPSCVAFVEVGSRRRFSVFGRCDKFDRKSFDSPSIVCVTKAYVHMEGCRMMVGRLGDIE